ncbi:MAG: hypothetical protein V4454_06930 [Pseudomonadota bacterium]
MKTSYVLSAVACLAIGSAASAQSPLPSVPNVDKTIGTQTTGSSTTALSFCTSDNAASLAQAAASAGNTGKKTVLTGWTIAETPGRISKVVAISSLQHPSCKPVQPLPAGGVAQMQLHVPYAVIDKASDWSTGFTALVMAIRDDALPAANYVPRLKRHVNLVTQLFETKGLDGYMVYAGEDHEWAYLHWPDEDTAKRAFATPDGATGPKDSRSIQRPVDRTQLFPAK